MVTFNSWLPLRASRRQLELLAPLRRIGFPAAARRTMPVELPRLEPAVFAAVARQPPRVAVYEIAHQLQVVAPLDGRDHQLSFEQLVQPEQRLVAPQLVLHQLVGRFGAFRVERRLEGDVEQIERRKAREVAAQKRQALFGAPERPVALEQALRHQREIRRVLLLDPLPDFDRAGMVARAGGEIAQNDVGADAFAVGGKRRVQMALCSVRARMRRVRHRKLAVVVRNFLLRGLTGLLFQLIDLAQEPERLGAMRRVLELEEHLLGAVEQPGLEVVLPELDHRVQPLFPAQVRALEKVAVHADRPLGLPAPAKQAPQRKMQLDGFRIDLDHLDERLDRLVGLLVEQEIEALEVRARQLPRFRQQLLDVDARGEPAQPEEQGKSEQPPELEVHARWALSLRRRGAVPARALLALEPQDLAALAGKAREAGEYPERRAGGEKQEQRDDHRRLPGLPEKEAQGHRIRIHEREGEYREKQQRPQQPRQMSDEFHAWHIVPKEAVLEPPERPPIKQNGGTSSMPPPARRRPSLLFLVDPLAQLLARLEVRDVFLRHVDLLARFRIAADARRPVIEPEAAEAADLDALGLHQALRHRVQDHLDRIFGVLCDELRIARREPRDQFGLGHSGPRLLLNVLVVQFRLQQRAEVGAAGAGGAFALELGHRLVLLGKVLLLDREIDGAVLAVDVDDHRVDAVAFLEMVAGVLDAVAGNLGSAQVAFDVARQVDHRPLRDDRLDGALDELALFVARDEIVERVALELLDAERDPLALDVDRQHLRLGLLALLEIPHRLLAGLRPGEVRKMHQTVYSSGQPDKDAEIGDRLDRAADFVAFLEVDSELFPRVRLALLHPERDAAPFLVDFEDHDLDLVAERDHLGRMHVLVGPVHLGHVHQSLDALLDLDESAVVGEIGHLAEKPRPGRITARQSHPGIFAELLQSERHAALLGVEREHIRDDLIADGEHLGRMLDPPPGEIGDVQQAVDSAQVHERAVVGDVLDDALDRRAFLQVGEQRLALGALRGLEHRAP